jgi:hypothetical protein
MEEDVLTPLAIEFRRRTVLENPYTIETEKSDDWLAGAAIAGIVGTPKEKVVPEAHQGYDWGVKFRESWERGNYND